MSRCFPFPPPGYERNHRLEDLNLLKEAKHKEKRHKNDKERKKDKEKDKVGGDEKHRDKKDRKEKHKEKKEKHRDKRKDKEDRGKDKEKSSISEESTVAGKLGNEGGVKLDPKGLRNDRNSSLNEGKSSNIFHGQSGVKPSQNSHPSQVIDNSKFVQELDRRIRDDENGRGSQLPQKLPVLDKWDQDMDMAARAAIRNSSGILPEERSGDKNKTIDRKIDPRGSDDVHSKNKPVQNVPPTSRCKVDGISKPLDEQNGRRLGEKEKSKEASDVKWWDKQKMRDIESRGMEKKKNESVKVKTENKKSEWGLLKDNDGRNDLSGPISNTTTDFLQSADNNSFSEGKIRKREDFGSNGFLHEGDVRPNKLQRSDPRHFTENGKKVEAFQTPSKPTHDVHPIANSLQSERKDQSKNGIIEVQKPSHPSKPYPVLATTFSDQIVEAPPHRESNSKSKVLKVPSIDDLIAEASRKPPHPDSRYLPDVLTVPNPSLLSENENDDWLYRKKDHSSQLDSAIAHKDFHVWSEAVHIVSADVCALPYVIPY